MKPEKRRTRKMTRLFIDVTEEDFETTEGEGEDLLPELLELTVWSEVQNDKEKEKELT